MAANVSYSDAEYRRHADNVFHDLAFKRAMLRAIRNGDEHVTPCVIRGARRCGVPRMIHPAAEPRWTSPAALVADLGSIS